MEQEKPADHKKGQATSEGSPATKLSGPLVGQVQRLAGQARRPHWLLTVAYFSHGTGRLHRGLLRPRQRRRSDSATPFRRDVLILRSHPASLRPQAVDCSAYPAERCIIVAYRPSVEHLSLFGVLVGRGAELLVVAGEREVGSGGEKEGFGLIRAKLFLGL